MLRRVKEYRTSVVYLIPDMQFPGAEAEFADSITSWAQSAGEAWLEVVRMAEVLHYEIVKAYEPIIVW